jgi:CheY-like chemotaxis protein
MLGIVRALGALMFDYHPPVVENEEESTPTAHNVAKTTVLAIDDDEQFLEMMRPLLCERGFNVITASSSPKGLNFLRYSSHDIKVVLLDFHMPEHDGAETLQFIRQIAPQVKVVGLTGVRGNELPSSFRQGVDHLLEKPFRTDDVANALTALVCP